MHIKLSLACRNGDGGRWQPSTCTRHACKSFRTETLNPIQKKLLDDVLLEYGDTKMRSAPDLMGQRLKNSAPRHPRPVGTTTLGLVSKTKIHSGAEPRDLRQRGDGPSRRRNELEYGPAAGRRPAPRGARRCLSKILLFAYHFCVRSSGCRRCPEQRAATKTLEYTQIWD
ncbi:hypothetical protein EVAR_81606_1 [Eumeta japonica]|uniref:Uncharacterized protein n=1 Tax=Eumeta variegata TaxID=151549 RepID=A0A4C1WCC0_EUMVA|nr:hypothetical protein EVAR_81606_1 [Eumeta japonica]